MVGKVRRSVAGGGRAPGAYRRRRRACRGPRSLRLWPGGGGRKARRRWEPLLRSAPCNGLKSLGERRRKPQPPRVGKASVRAEPVREI